MTLLDGDPRSVGGYRLEGRLGAGGMGVVFLARSVSGRRLAVKVIRPELATDDEFRVRFRREVAAARRVSGAFTAPVVDADADAEQPWLATLFVPGDSLHRRVTEQGPLPAREVRQLAAGLVEALRDIHRAGLTHRDLKPGNVLLSDDGPRVIDFGIAHAADGERLTQTGVVVGTPAFMAPEQFTADTAGPAADVFALGSVLAFAATGHGPFSGDSSHAIGFRVVYEEPDLNGLPQELRPLVTACLAKDPERRPTVEGLHDSLMAPAPDAQDDSATPDTPDTADIVAATPADVPPATVADAAVPAPVPARLPTPTLRPAVPPPPAGEFGPAPGDPAGPPGGRTRPSRTRVALTAGAALLLVAAAAVTVPLLVNGDDGDGRTRAGRDGPSGVTSSGASETSAAAFSCAGASGNLRGSGASSVDPVVTAWTSGFATACPGADVQYDPTGTGAGVLAFTTATTHFALTDSPLSAADRARADQRCPAGGALVLPLAATPVAVVHHLPGVRDLVMDAPTLAAVFDGTITRWDDPAIRRLNPGTALPSQAITAVHRSDASATTRTFTGYLAGAAPAAWSHGSGTSWPGRAGQGAQSARGLRAQVTQVPGAIGYLDLGDAAGLDTVRLATGASKPVAATSAATTTAVGAGDPSLATVALDPATHADGAYPLARVDSALVCAKGNDARSLPVLKAFLSYTVGAQGQETAVRQGHARLPEALAARVRTAVGGLG
ncbi:substrate-binding domain-containing protein [Streptomyces sp. NPDC046977]|uniref:protein kinase domain-containing protein n=1 Tax=Streptomyces sp. NPDC046977 TaxID=3154703 RepID=UPI0033F15B3F